MNLRSTLESSNKIAKIVKVSENSKLDKTKYYVKLNLHSISVDYYVSIN